MSDRFDIRWIGHCEPGNKIWGWYFDNAILEARKDIWRSKVCFCFWAVCGKTISIKPHTYRYHQMDELTKKKVGNGYTEISKDQLLVMWPEFHQDLHRKVIFEMLSSDMENGQ